MIKKGFQILVYIFAVIGFLFVSMYFAVKYGITNTTGIIDTQREAFIQGSSAAVPASDSTPLLPWSTTEEWGVLDASIRKDISAINRASKDSGVPARAIVENLVAEQLRLFFTEREVYKQFFLPLKILGSQTQFSWGVMGIKEDTAIQIENNLKNPASPYYPGTAYEHALDFSTASSTDIKQERFARMTSEHDHYWSYVYAGLYLKEIETAWAKSGFPIANKPAVLSTLFNIGFTHSNPNANPQIGGAEIDVGTNKYSFGGLAGDFYDSNLLTDVFPK